MKRRILCPLMHNARSKKNSVCYNGFKEYAGEFTVNGGGK